MIRGDLGQARALVERSDEIHRRRTTSGAWRRRLEHSARLRAMRAMTRRHLSCFARARGSRGSRESHGGRVGALASSRAPPSARTSWMMRSARLAPRSRSQKTCVTDRVAFLPRRFCAGIAAERGETERAGRLWAVVENSEYGAPWAAGYATAVRLPRASTSLRTQTSSVGMPPD